MKGTTHSFAIRGAALAGAVAGCLQAPAAAQTAPAVYDQLDAGVHALVVSLRIRPDASASFLALVKERIAQSRREPAVVDFRIMATADPALFLAFESFGSASAFRDFAQTDASKDFLARLQPMLSAPPQAQVLKPLP